MKTREYADQPIDLKVLTHTDKVDGDDSGYRKWPVEENNDPIVVVAPSLIRQELVYGKGPVPALCPYYEGSLKATTVAMVRQPVLAGLLRLDSMLSDVGLGVLLVDGWRAGDTQVALWNYLFDQAAEKEGFKNRSEMSVFDIVRLGDAADEIGSYNAAEENDAFALAVNKELEGDRAVGIHQLAAERNEDVKATAATLVTYEANRGWRMDVQLSKTASTAHGNGGATDIYMFDRSSGNPVCLGVPFDYAGKAARMDYMEDEGNFDPFMKAVETDPLLRRYLAECGVDQPTIEDFRTFARNRRTLYHTTVSLGSTIYVAEPWHFNWGCGHGDSPESGNGCQALLKNATAAVWSNAFANEQVAKILGGTRKFATTHV